MTKPTTLKTFLWFDGNLGEALVSVATALNVVPLSDALKAFDPDPLTAATAGDDYALLFAHARPQALALAQKRRFGPFGSAELDRPAREKQIAAMLRAGHPLDMARTLVTASDRAAAEEWAETSEDDE